MDCMRLFTKEDILDGDEKPVSHFSTLATTCFQDSSLGVLLSIAYPTRELLASAHTGPCKLCLLCLSDMLPLQNQKTMHKEVLYPEVPKDLGAPYP